MARQAPDPIDVQDFQFILHCRLRIFANDSNNAFAKPSNLISVASRFGLVFVGCENSAFQVIQLSEIEKHTVKEGEVTTYNRRNISLPAPPKHLSVNCDCTKVAVVVEKSNCPVVLIYDIPTLTNEQLPKPTEIRLSPTPGVFVTETTWNPTVPSIFTVCKSDGSLGVYDFKDSGIDINELPIDSQATCMCWSPKGKQLAVGSHNGKITQYKPDLKAMKVVNAPPFQGSPSVLALQWISNYQFIAIYKLETTDSGAVSLVVVDAPKTGDTVYTNYDDICYSYGNNRPDQFYIIHQPTWNILMVASSNSMEVGVLGSLNEQWTLWTLSDAARAELPLSATKQETLPVGLAFDTSSTEAVIWGESSLPPAPYLLLLSHHGLLCCFRVINVKSGTAYLCRAPEPLVHTSGLSQFTSISTVNVQGDQPKASEEASIPLKSAGIAAPQPLTPQVTIQPVLTPAIKPVEAKPVEIIPAQLPPTSTKPETPFFTPPAFTAGATMFSSGGQFTFQPPKTEAFQAPKTDAFQPPKAEMFQPPKAELFVTKTSTETKPVQPSFFGAVKPQTAPAPSVTITKTPPPASTVPVLNIPVVQAVKPEKVENAQPGEDTVESPSQEENDVLISKLLREEYAALEIELQALLHKGRALKIDLGSDTEAVDLVHDADSLEEFFKEVKETSAAQAAEVHTLKQGLIQTWAWYEDVRSRHAQSQDTALEALLQIQQLDPVSQRYLAEIDHITYYLNSQLSQAVRVLDDQWENFQDSCKKIVKLKIPTMETIYQTMVRQSAILQRQQYILKDISCRIQAQRSKVTNPALLISLSSAGQLEKELRRLQLEPRHYLQSHYERVLQNQKNLTSSKVDKLSKLLLNREIGYVAYKEPKASSSLKSASLTPHKTLINSTLLGVGVSPIASKQAEIRPLDFLQSTPKSAPSLSTVPIVSSEQKPAFVPPEISTVGFKAPLLAKISTTTPSATVQVHPSPVIFATKPQPGSTVSLNKPATTFLVSTPPSSLTPPVQIQATVVDLTKPTNLFATSQPLQTKFSTESSQSKPFSFTSLNIPKSTQSGLLTASLNTGITTGSVTPLSSTVNSAFVPTSQTQFNFQVKVVSTASGAAKPPFVFGTTSAFGAAKPGVVISSPVTTSVTLVTSSAASPVSTAAVSKALSPSTTVASSVASKNPETSIFGGFPVSKPLANFSSIPSLSEPAKTAPTSASSPFFSAPATANSTFSFASAAAHISQPQTTSATSTTTLFGKNFTGSLFGTAVSTPASLFGGTTTTASIFGGTTSTASVFGGTAVTSVFGASNAKPSAIATTSAANVAPKTATPHLPEPASIVTSTTTTKPHQNFFLSGSEPIFGGSTTTTAVSAPSIPATTAVLTSTTAATTTSTTNASVFGLTAPSSQGSLLTAKTTNAGFATTSAPTFPTTSALTFGAPGATTSTSTFGAPSATISVPNFEAPSVTTSTPSFGAPSATTSAPAFGTPATSTSAPAFGLSSTASDAFKATTAASVFSTPVTSVFGNLTTSSDSVFGTASTSTPAFGQTTGSLFIATSPSSVFGETAKTTASVLFRQPSFGNTFGNPTTSNTTFGSPTTASSTFGSTTTSTGGSIFGQPAQFGSNSVFGAPTSSSNTFGAATTNSSVFGAPATSSSVFGTPTTTSSVFGAATTASSVFGGAGFGNNTSVFGTSNASTGFGQTQQPSTFSFAAAAANISSPNSPFGGSSSGGVFSKPSTFGFGTSNSDQNAFTFGTLSVGSPTTTSSAFGSGFGSPAANPFAKASSEQKTSFSGGSLFGTPPTTTSSSIFGGGAAFGGGSTFGSPGFGSQSTFGQQSTTVFGQNTFGNTSPSGPFSATNQSVAQSGFGSFGQSPKPSGFGAAPVFSGSPGGFGSPATFGSSPTFGSTPAFGSTPKMFGNPNTPTTASFGAPAQQENPTFANLANQNTLGFGSLAQQSQTNPTPLSFSGGSSFSTWR